MLKLFQVFFGMFGSENKLGAVAEEKHDVRNNNRSIRQHLKDDGKIHPDSPSSVQITPSAVILGPAEADHHQPLILDSPNLLTSSSKCSTDPHASRMLAAAAGTQQRQLSFQRNGLGQVNNNQAANKRQLSFQHNKTSSFAGGANNHQQQFRNRRFSHDVERRHNQDPPRITSNAVAAAGAGAAGAAGPVQGVIPGTSSFISSTLPGPAAAPPLAQATGPTGGMYNDADFEKPTILSKIFGREFVNAWSNVLHSGYYNQLSSVVTSVANGRTFLDDLQLRQKQLAEESPFSWPNGDRRTYLIVDYNTQSRKNIVKKMADQGQLVYQSTDGLGCLRALDDLKLRGEVVDVIIIEADDFMLPSISGTETIKLLRSREYAVETIVIGLTTEERKVMKKLDPFTMLIASPIKFDQLADALNTIDDEKSANKDENIAAAAIL